MSSHRDAFRVMHRLATRIASLHLLRMDQTALITRIRDHYVDQYCAFIRQQKASCTHGASEVKLQLSEQSRLFDRLYCADFIKNDAVSEIIEFQPGNVLAFEAIFAGLGNTSLSIADLQWHDVLIRHDLNSLPADEVSRWFQVWFDPEEARAANSSEVSGAIHSMLIESSGISIDFGTAHPDAFWDLLQLLQRAGAAWIEVRSSGPEDYCEVTGAQ